MMNASISFYSFHFASRPYSLVWTSLSNHNGKFMIQTFGRSSKVNTCCRIDTVNSIHLWWFGVLTNECSCHFKENLQMKSVAFPHIDECVFLSSLIKTKISTLIFRHDWERSGTGFAHTQPKSGWQIHQMLNAWKYAKEQQYLEHFRKLSNQIGVLRFSSFKIWLPSVSVWCGKMFCWNSPLEKKNNKFHI